MTLQVLVAPCSERLPADLELDLMRRLPEPLRERLARFRRWEDRQAGLFGKLLLERALDGRPEVPARPLERLEYAANGKPFLAQGPGFNISHSGGVVVLALADRGEVGIDVEQVRALDPADFREHLPELEKLYCLEPALLLEGFFDCWTSKEAVLKGDGAGLGLPLASVRLEGDNAFCRGRSWRLRRIDCGPGYRCHVATSETPAQCRTEVINLER